MTDIEKNIQIIRSGRKPSFVVIPHENWLQIQSLIEEASDIRAYDRAKAAWKRGDKKAYPAAITKRITDGEHPVKVFREWRKLSQSQLARRAGLNAQSISHIETGTRKGGLSAMRKIAKTLDVSLDLLTEG